MSARGSVTMLALLALVGAGAAQATVVQTSGSHSAVKQVLHAASFDANASLANNYAEDGLVFRFTGAGNNNGCGYAGIDCYDTPSELGAGFDGNYLATAGSNAYISIRMGDGSDFYRLEFAAGSGYANVYGHWKTYNDNLLTGAGNFANAAGAIIGLRDEAGFDEVRYFAFSSDGRSAGFSAAAIDSVWIGVPEPGSAGLFCLGLACLTGLRRRYSD